MSAGRNEAQYKAYLALQRCNLDVLRTAFRTRLVWFLTRVQMNSIKQIDRSSSYLNGYCTQRAHIPLSRTEYSVVLRNLGEMAGGSVRKRRIPRSRILPLLVVYWR